jgi:hypothetical protein
MGVVGDDDMMKQTQSWSLAWVWMMVVVVMGGRCVGASVDLPLLFPLAVCCCPLEATHGSLFGSLFGSLLA